MEKVNKNLKDLIFTIHNVCPRDTSTIINNSNNYFAIEIDFETSPQT